MIAGQLPPPHARAVVNNREQRLRRISLKAHPAGVRIQRVRHNLGQYGFFHRTRIRISQILQQM